MFVAQFWQQSIEAKSPPSIGDIITNVFRETFWIKASILCNDGNMADWRGRYSVWAFKRLWQSRHALQSSHHLCHRLRRHRNTLGCYIIWTMGLGKRDDLSQWPSNLAKAASGSVSPKRQSSIDDDERFVNPARWDALIRFDPEISAAVAKLRPYGEKWIDEYRRNYFALDEDRSYLSSTTGA